MHPYFQELAQNETEIRNALASGETPETIYGQLAKKGVPTTVTRISHFCEEVNAAEYNAALFPNPLHLDFPDLTPYRETVESLLSYGMSNAEVWAILVSKYQIKVSRERTAAYIKRLLFDLFPPGAIQRHLYQIPAPNRKWVESDPVMSYGDDNSSDVWTVGDVCQGTIIFGAPGSGKTTASGRSLAVQYLRSGFGGIVLTAKPGEAQNWLKLCHYTERGEDVRIIGLDRPLKLNILQYEAEHPGPGSTMTSNLVDFLQNLVSAINSNHNQHANEEFWRLTGRQLLTNLVDAFLLAGEPLTLDGLCEFIGNAPLRIEDAKDDAWFDRPVFGPCLSRAAVRVRSDEDRRIYQKLSNYWLNIYPGLAPETRSCITIAFTSMADVLRGRHIYDLLSTITTITPEQILGGKIVVLDLSLSEYHDAGVLVQCAWKYLLQRAVLRRKDQGAYRRPVFFWEDEGHNFLIDHDVPFQAMSREFRAARVLITQNLNNFYSKFGPGGQAKADSLIANINTRYFHANGDTLTNAWASDYIGTEYKTIREQTITPMRYQGLNPIKSFIFETFKRPTISTSTKTNREPIAHPHEFLNLQTGNPQNGFVVHVVISQVGRTCLPTGKHFTSVSIKQIFLPENIYEGSPAIDIGVHRLEDQDRLGP